MIGSSLPCISSSHPKSSISWDNPWGVMRRSHQCHRISQSRAPRCCTAEGRELLGDFHGNSGLQHFVAILALAQEGHSAVRAMPGPYWPMPGTEGRLCRSSEGEDFDPLDYHGSGGHSRSPKETKSKTPKEVKGSSAGSNTTTAPLKEKVS